MYIVHGFLSDLHCDKDKDKCIWNVAFIDSDLINQYQKIQRLVLKTGTQNAGAHVALLQLVTRVVVTSKAINSALDHHEWYTATVLSRILLEGLAYLHFCLKDNNSERINNALNAYRYSGYASWISVKKYSANEDPFRLYNDAPIFSKSSQADDDEVKALNQYRKNYSCILKELRMYDCPDADKSVYTRDLSYKDMNYGKFENVKMYSLDRCKFYSVPFKVINKGKTEWHLIHSFAQLVTKVLHWDARYYYVYMMANPFVHTDYSLDMSFDTIKRDSGHGSYDVFVSQVLNDTLYLCLFELENVDSRFGEDAFLFENDEKRKQFALFDDTKEISRHAN